MRISFGHKLILPYILFIASLMLYFLVSNTLVGFTAKGGGFTFERYRVLLFDPLTWKIFKNTLFWVVGSVIGQYILGFSVALLLRKIGFGQALFRSIIFILPWVTLDLVAGVSWRWMYNDLYGVINDMLTKIGAINEPVSWLGSSSLAQLSVIIANIWKGFSLAGIFLLARLQTIPNSLYEAAEIDGAGSFNKFRLITLPQVRTVSLSTLMLMVIWTINYFPLIYIMTGGGPNFATETVVTYIYKLRFTFLEVETAAALSNLLFLFILGIAFLFLKSIAKGGEE